MQSNKVMMKAKQWLQIYLLQRKLFNPPSSTSDDGILAFETLTTLRARHDGKEAGKKVVGSWIFIACCRLIRILQNNKSSEAVEKVNSNRKVYFLFSLFSDISC